MDLFLNSLIWLGVLDSVVGKQILWGVVCFTADHSSASSLLTKLSCSKRVRLYSEDKLSGTYI